MDRRLLLLLLLLLLGSSGLQTEGPAEQQGTGARCQTIAKADIALLLDNSWNIRPAKFNTFKTFITQTVAAFDIGPNKVQIAVTQNVKDLDPVWRQNKESLQEAIDQLSYRQHNSRTGTALDHLLHIYFKGHMGMRADSQRYAVLITDRAFWYDVEIPSQHLRDSGIEVYAIGVGAAEEEDLRIIASDPDDTHVIKVPDFPSLLDIAGNFSMNLCNSINHSGLAVRLVNGTSPCSGRLEVRSDRSEHSWSSVCESAFNQNDSEVVCRELECGGPSGIQGVFYDDAEGPLLTRELQCQGHESSLLDCGSSGEAGRSCLPGKAVGLSCSEPIRLVGEPSRCAGTLEFKRGEWRPVFGPVWSLNEAAVACRALNCGSAVAVTQRRISSIRSLWWIHSECVKSGSALKDCISSYSFSSSLGITCSDLLVQPLISVSSSEKVLKAQQQGALSDSIFIISCSIQPQYPGGFFHLIFTSSKATENYTQPAVNHTADFVFPATDSAYQRNYSCAYEVSVFSHTFYSESRVLSPVIPVVPDPTIFFIRLVVLLLSLLSFVSAICYTHKVTRAQAFARHQKFILSRAKGRVS